ncbi:DUF4065 domain-containing protein [Microvirga sp. ACRRW]|uniref:Panacea domain-containing protein n=1 Tax=Microvirga sp. ACRRW TaxID=2918205 RepID=UPI001EF4406F|nr:type II toxin-antitoxin system antitoxin SocA domain-containing protein [Microvirga sp. ACRRW]MCG7394057.1 DUF4065 domain-containing protein [Microvirga sp. ACRRW]
MHDARAITNFFLEKAWASQAPITIMTLLKVLYFAHAWYLAKTGKALVGQPFEAWKHGPVSRVVYEQYKNYGSKPLDKKAVSFDPSALKYVETPYFIDGELEDFLNSVFEYYSKFHPYTLSDLTHEKGAPWDLVWTEAQNRAVPGMVIPNELIRSWFLKRDNLYPIN